MEEKKILCPACGSELELKLEDFSIGQDGRSGLMSLLRDEYVVDLYACPGCGKVEMYTAGFGKKQEKPEEENVTCPVCGREHSALIGCPTCALRNAQTRPFPAASRKKKEKRPPWEK